LFDVKQLRGPADVSNDTDILAFANFTALSDLYLASGVTIPTYVENPAPVMDMFEDKAAWKTWMTRIGLGAHIPQILDVNLDPAKHQYPLVLKTNVHFGRGVYIVHNAQDLRNITSTLKAQQQTYLMEEALTGMGLSEVTVFGSAFRGRLLSLHCLKRTSSQKELLKTAFRNSSVAVTDSAVDPSKVPFVRGFRAKAAHEQWLPCGRDQVRIASRMMQAASYTGSWCTTVKLDNDKRPKLLEVNARYCGTLVNNDALFVAAFVPLAGAIAKAFPEAKVNHALFKGPRRKAFHRILEHEEKVLRTGGGPHNGNWVNTDKFDPDLRLDHLHDHFVYIRQHYIDNSHRLEP
jgi:hypothetical protein